MDKIIFDNVSKSYGSKFGIQDLNLEVNKGEIIGLIGPNGAGKSTTIRSMLNLINKTSGSINIFGLDSVKQNVKILNNVGYLPGELNYYDNAKGIDILKYSESFYKKDCSKKRQELAELLDFNMNLKVSSLSLGNKKKLGIIDALQHEPDLLIFDEPTSGLDPLMQQRFFDVLEKEKQRGVTIIFSSHIISEVQRICDRVAIIKDSKLLTVENVEDIRKRQVKNITLETKQKLTNKIVGMKDIEIKDNKAKFVFDGDMNNLILFLTKYEIIDIEISEPTLEQVFLHFYE